MAKRKVIKHSDKEIIEVLTSCGGNRTEAARRLGTISARLNVRLKEIKSKGKLTVPPPPKALNTKIGLQSSVNLDRYLNETGYGDDREDIHEEAPKESARNCQRSADPELLAIAEHYVRKATVHMALGNWDQVNRIVDQARQGLRKPSVETKPFLDEPLASCNIPTRTLNAIDEYCDAIYIRDLQNVSTQQLMAIPSLGAGSIDKLWLSVLKHAATRISQLQENLNQ